MLSGTPEYVQAHISNITPSTESAHITRHRLEAIARIRSARRARVSRFAASVYRSLRFVKEVVEVEPVPTKAPQTV